MNKEKLAIETGNTLSRIIGFVVGFLIVKAFFGSFAKANDITYQRIGSAVYGSDGSYANQIGNTIYTNQGVSYQQIGNSVYGSNGYYSNRIGDTTYTNKGTTYQQIGNTTFGSDGTTYQQIGNTIFENDYQ